jgi:hypothetical protein
LKFEICERIKGGYGGKMHAAPTHTCIIEGLKKILVDRLARLVIWRVYESFDGVW